MKLSRKLGDRYDGYRVKKITGPALLIPYIMKTRVDSQVYYEDDVEITAIEEFMRKHQEDIPGISLYHIIIAAILRTYSQRPYLNRFVVDSKIYARNHFCISMMVKKGVHVKGDDTLVKPELPLDGTVYDVVDAFKKIVEENKVVEHSNGTDDTVDIIGHLPHWLVKFVINTLMFMDKKNCMPKFMNKVSPFHTSFFITNIGSIGIEPIYHHIYEFGTTSLFLAIGKKRTVVTTDENGNVVKRRFMGFKIVGDERICDGHYYSESARIFMRFLRHPEKLLEPPEKIFVDDGINKLYDRYIIDEKTGKKTGEKFDENEKYEVHRFHKVNK
ncbi:MAG: 2-oxo acid dehydrogenase subunit E2 [Clostridia bacterium]|nr:2-oxo acid dehydrogenase subunit E2 [Clostridia bacterium]